jgi:3-deoxy-D-manno-octulosonate 8-phosphate phosphatase (KDO 8-P phosphatase)
MPSSQNIEKNEQMTEFKQISPQKISLIAFDFDGVLTDNKVYVFQDGKEAVCCSRADGIGFDFLHKMNIPVVIISTESNPVVSARAAKLRVPVIQSQKDKYAALDKHCLENGLDVSRVMFVGNDVNDLPVMRQIKYAIAVADAFPAVKAVAWHILGTPGGNGIVREIIESVIDFPPADQILNS